MAAKLPTECLLEIFKYIEAVDKKSLYSVILVNRTWCQISVPILWRTPFKEHRQFKVILPLISYFDKENKNLLKIDETTTYYHIPEKPTFNYASFIKELDYINMYHQGITCLTRIRESQKCSTSLTSTSNLYYQNYSGIKHETLDSSKFIELIYKIIINNSRIETLILDMYYWRSKDTFNALLKTLGQENGFSLNKIHCKLLAKDVYVLCHFLRLANNQIRDLSLSLYDDSPYSSDDFNLNLDLINLIKSQHHLERLHVNENSCFAKLILSELQNNVHSIVKLNLLSHNNIEKSGYYLLKDEWSNSLELTFNDSRQKDDSRKVTFSNLKTLKLDWNTTSYNQSLSQENEILQPIISLIQNNNIDLKHIDLIKLSEFHFKNIFKTISKYCLNLKKFSYSIHNLNDLRIIYTIFQNNLELLSIDIDLFIPVTQSFFTEFAQNIPDHIQNITLGNSFFDQNALNIFLDNIKCTTKLKSFKFKFIWKNGEDQDIFKKISDEKGWIIKDYKLDYRDRDIVSLEWV